MELPEHPSILVLLVATDGAQWLPDVLRGLRAQKYRPIKVLAIDNASGDGSAAILARAFGQTRVVTLDRRIGYGRALAAGLKVASERALDSDAFLLLHDDTALEPGAIESMVETMTTRGAGIVGAKLLEWDNPTILQDVGQTTDRYGRSVTLVERGELDQGQHEGVRRTLYANSAALLIAREVIETVGLFDLRYVAMRDDLDLCWRARMAGYETVVDLRASARHAAAVARDLRASAVRGRTRYFAERNMIATLIKNYSLPHLALALPFTMMVSFLNSILYFVSGRRDSAVQNFQALQWNIAHLPSTIRTRARVQRSRTQPDNAVTDLMHHGATRIRAQLARAAEIVVGEVKEATEEDLERPPPRLSDRIRAHPAATLILLSAIVGIIGARTVFVSRPLGGLDLFPFPHSMRGFFQEFASGWRGPAAGGAVPASPGLVVLGIISFITFGSGWLAERVLVLGLPLIGALTMYRLCTSLGMGARGRRLAVIAYASSPLMLAAFGGGRFPDLVLFASAPALVIPLLRAAGILPETGWRSTAAGVAWLAVATSLAPWSLIFLFGSGLVIAALCAGVRKSTAPDVLKRTGMVIGGALVLLLPWSIELFRSGSPIGGGGVDPMRSMVDLLGLSAGPIRIIPIALAFGVPVAGLTGLAAAPLERRRAAIVLAGYAGVSVVIAWAVARGVPWIAPRAALPLAGAAVAWTVLAGIGFDAVGTRLRERTFGRRQLVAGITGLLLVVQLVAAGAWIARGHHSGLVEADELVPSFLFEQASQQGAFRIVWIDGTATDPTVALTGPSGQSMVDYLDRSAGAGATALRHTIAAIASGTTESGGRLLATLGVRYVVVRPQADASLSAAVARQVDLSFSQRFHNASVYENEVGLPVAATISRPGWVAGAAGQIGRAHV